MARLPMKGTPWMTALQLAMAARRRWSSLHADDRAELGRLVAKAKGGPSALTPGDRAELRRIVALLDLTGLGLEVLPFGKSMAKRRRR